MIPLRDKNPSSTTPLVTMLLIVTNVLVFFYELSLGVSLHRFLMHYALVPAKLVYYGEVPGIAFTGILGSFLFSMFLHGGWLHIIGNMWYLWIFGDNVEDRLGHGRFLLFYITCGIVASVVHIFFNSRSTMPVVGASGAIAGVLGAYLVSFPFARIITAVPIFFFFTLIEIPAAVLLLFWFVLQFFSGALSIAVSAHAGGGGVAWWAHVGGFVGGMILINIFSARKKVYRRV
jgi:membrane associated rhomboid family serine protease